MPSNNHHRRREQQQHHHHHHGGQGGMSRASSLQSFLDPVSPLSIPVLDDFLRASSNTHHHHQQHHDKTSSAAGTATRGTRTPPPGSAVPSHLDPTALQLPGRQSGSPTSPAGGDKRRGSRPATAAEAFSTSYFRGKPTAEAFERHQAQRERDARRRLRDVERAERVREARLTEIRTTHYAEDCRRASRLAHTERKHEDHIRQSRDALLQKQSRAARRRQQAAAARAEALHAADAHRSEVRGRYALLGGANAVVQDATCQAACTLLAPLSRCLNDAFHAAAESHRVAAEDIGAPTCHEERAVGARRAKPLPSPERDAANAAHKAPYVGRAVVPYCAELHGRMAHAAIVETIEETLIADPVLSCRHCGAKGDAAAAAAAGQQQQQQQQQPHRATCPKTGGRHPRRLPTAAGELLDALLAGAALPATPEVSPSKPPHTASPNGDSGASAGGPPSPLKLPGVAETPPTTPERAGGDSCEEERAPAAVVETAPSPAAYLAPEYVQQMTTWARLEDPGSRDLVCRQLIGAHHAAAEFLSPAMAMRRKRRAQEEPSASSTPERHRPAPDSDATPTTTPSRTPTKFSDALADDAAPYSDTRVLGSMAVVLVRELHGLIASITSAAPVHHRRVVKLLGAWDAYCVATVEEEIRKKKVMVAGLGDGLVQLRLAEYERAADIRAKGLAATAAGPHSAQARRERIVAPRRSVLSSAVQGQINYVTRRLRALGGDAAVVAAEACAADTIARIEAGRTPAIVVIVDESEPAAAAPTDATSVRPVTPARLTAATTAPRTVASVRTPAIVVIADESEPAAAVAA